MKMTKYLWLWMLFATFPLHLSSAQKVEDSSTKIAVIFNTLCAKCHEGECSGRLSFDTGSKAANSHIRRYAGDTNISKGDTEDFFSLLNHMKKECELWMPDSGEWKPESLSHFALPSAKGYFIPLGLLKEGKYHVEIKIKDDIHFRVEVLSDHFDHFLDKAACPDGEKETLQFTIDKSVNTFLRIQSKKPLQIIALKVCRSLL
ncbi:MAG TPA: hypothetical protein ENI25_03580 [Epsilonproteobacteria bacterium]|nr:hypothetical protein [Campylobacterota bacterium]